MKKLFFVVAVVGGLSMIAQSCAKDWTCECTGTVLGINYTVDTTLTDMKKGDAETTCDGFDWTLGSDSQDCELK